MTISCRTNQIQQERKDDIPMLECLFSIVVDYCARFGDCPVGAYFEETIGPGGSTLGHAHVGHPETRRRQWEVMMVR